MRDLGGSRNRKRHTALVLIPLSVTMLVMAFAAAGWAAPAPPDPPVEEAAAPATSAPPEEAPAPSTTEAPPTTVATTEPPPPATEAPPPASTAAPAPSTTEAPPTTAVEAPASTVVTTEPPPASPEPPPAEAVPPQTTEPDNVILDTPDPTGTISMDKTNTADGEPAGDDTIAEPGDVYTYNFLATCSSINVDCVNLTIVDDFPDDVIVDESTIPASIPGFREVTYVAATQTLTVVYVEPLANPPGATGKLAGTSDSFTVSVTLPADTPLETGAVIPNDATLSSFDVEGNPIEATDPSNVTVNVPRVVAAQIDKSFSDPSAIAGDPDATTTIGLVADNQSSSSAEVTEMVVEDSTPDTFEYLDFISATVTQYPAGAEQAQLFVCPSANAPCDSDDDYVAGGTGTPPGPSTLTLPPTVPAGDVVGVRVVFTAADGSFIENVANGGTAAVDIEMDLRDTVRSTGQPIVEIPETTTIDNVATTTVTDPGADPAEASDDDTAQYQILPPTLNLDPSKSFFADENGNYSTDAGEHVVIGENSGVSMIMNATNISAFPIAEIVIQEPSDTAANEFAKFDADSIQLTFPTGAVNANVVVTYEDGTTTDADYTEPGTVELHPPAARVTSITVTYTGPDADGDGEPDPTIEPGATAGLGVHGNLNDGVDATDVADGIENCADYEGSGGGVPGSTGTFVGTECTNLDVEERSPDIGGDKTASQIEIPPGQPVVFTLHTENTGNLPLFDVVVADPPLAADGTPATPSIFENLRFVDATITNDNVAADIALEVHIVGQGWVAYPGPTGPQLRLVNGVRATVPTLAPTESFDLLIEVELRFVGDPDATLSNCYSVTDSGDEFDVETFCGPPLTPTDLEEAATLNKFISPETVPERIPGSDPEDSAATVQLRVQNTGTLTAQFLQITDNDTDFWDAVDFARLGEITPPATGANLRADRIQIDAFVDGAWVNGTPTAIGSAALPAGVANDDVRGLRFTFSSTLTFNDGYVITPCNEDPLGECAGIVEFVVHPRLTLVSTGEPLPGEPVPDPLLDTASGAFDTLLTPGPTDIAPVSDDLSFRPGDPQLDVNKTPENQTLQPGQFGTFNLVTTNNGTANLPDLTVSDPLPEGILFDDTFVGPDGGPYEVSWSNLPDGYPAPPEPVFEMTADPADPTRVGNVRWTFPGFDMPPNATVTIFFRYTLEPGVVADQEIVNTMGASSPVDDLACTEPDVVVTDGEFGSGIYCTDPANVTVTSGANFASRKWVAGNPDLGWYNESTGELVPVGGGGCLSLEGPEGTYTTNPCIAITNPGEPFHYVLRVQNAGTEPALTMTVVDKFPAPGDTGVFGADRGTQWANRPTLAGAAEYNGPATGEIQYTTGTPCAGGREAWPCDDADWTAGPGADTTGLRMLATFDPDLLPPGGTVDIYFSMVTPLEVPRVEDPTVAYNSIAHSETTQTPTGDVRDLAPLEPLKVGVATLYGNLQVLKAIGDNPAGLPLDDVEFTFTYECTISVGAPGPSGTATATPTTPGVVTEIPSGSTCEVWESGTNGGIPDATEASPVEVVIEPSVDPDTPVVSTVTVTNDFPLGELELLKEVTGFDNPEFVSGPYPVTVDCTFNGTSVPGFPVEDEVTVGTPTVIDTVPVGSVCTVTETDDNGATTVTYDPPGGVITIPSEEGASVSVTITNDFPFGAVELLKTVTGGSDPVFTPGPYTARLTCAFNGATLPGFPVDVELVPDVPSESFVAPVNSVCTVTETDDQGATTVTYDPANAAGTAGEVTVPVGSDAEPISITITNDFPDGGLEVNKAIGQNDANLVLDDVVFTFRYQCTFDPDPEVEGDEITSPDPAALLVATVNNPAEVTGLPAGAVCEVWETIPGNQGGIPDATEEDPAVVTIEPGRILQPFTPVTVTNDFPSIPVELLKLVEGDAQEEFTGGPYTIEITCWATDQIPGIGEPFPGTPVVVLVFANEPLVAELPVGTICWFQEVGLPEGVTVTYDPATPNGDAGVAIVPDDPPPDDEPLIIIEITNTFTTGSLVIEKTVSGPGAPAFSQGPFVFDVTCDYQGVEDVFSTTVTIEGSPDGTSVESEPVTGLPLGAECTVTEIDNGGADIVTPPQTVTIEANEEANVAFVGVDNPFSAGSIAVVKQVDGTAADSDYVAGLEFTIAVECAVDEDGTLVTVYDGEVIVAGDGEAVPVTDDAGDPVLLPLGARCWGAEAESFGATAVSIDHDSYDNGVEVVADAEGGVQALQITVINTFDAGELTITKEAVNAPDSNSAYEFTVTCTITAADGSTTDVPLIDGTSPVSLGSGQSATLGTLAGARCRVVEDDPGNAEVTIVESGGAADDDPSDGIVTLDGHRSVAVTNTFPADAGGGGGNLPVTGTTILSILVIAAAFVAAGVLFVRVKRTRHRPT